MYQKLGRVLRMRAGSHSGQLPTTRTQLDLLGLGHGSEPIFGEETCANDGVRGGTNRFFWYNFRAEVGDTLCPRFWDEMRSQKHGKFVFLFFFCWNFNFFGSGIDPKIGTEIGTAIGYGNWG